jgi:hypothetical protein
MQRAPQQPGWTGPQYPPLPPQFPPTQPFQQVPPFNPPFNPAFHPGTASAPATRRSSTKRLLFVGAVLFLVLALAGSVGVVIFAVRRAAVSASPGGGETPTVAATPATPFDTAAAVLNTQATALVQGDAAGWLAAVDPSQPKLLTRYRTMYASLRGLGVSQFDYHPFIRPSKDKTATTVAMGVDISYCFSMDSCPTYTDSAWDGPPRISQSLTLKPVGGRYVITAVGKATEPNHLQPTPWESGELAFLQGERVTLAAPKSVASHLSEVLAVAEKAARVNDRFAAYVDNPQKRYRIYLADSKAWRSWYGGETNKWIVGYSMPLNEAESDVVLQTSQLLGDRQLMSTTIQHELGHVVTLGGAHGGDSDKDLWLIEGVAEYIGWSPRPATASWRRDGVRAAMHSSRPPKTIAAKPLADDAGAQAGDAFYGLGHFAVDCMAQKYGQRRLFDFVKMTLREGYGYEQASQEAYGKPFSTVDKACVAWIRQQA